MEICTTDLFLKESDNIAHKSCGGCIFKDKPCTRTFADINTCITEQNKLCQKEMSFREWYVKDLVFVNKTTKGDL